MAAQANRLLVHGRFICKDGGFRQNARLIDVRVLQQRFQLGVQLLRVFLHALGARLLDLAHRLLQIHQARKDIRPQLLPLGGAHGDEIFHRSLSHGLHVRPQLLLVRLCLACGEDI